MARYRLIDPAYETGYLGGVQFQPAIVDGSWVGVAEVDKLPRRLPSRIRVVSLEPEPEPDVQPDVPNYASLHVPELRALAQERGINTSGLRKQELIDALEASE